MSQEELAATLLTEELPKCSIRWVVLESGGVCAVCRSLRYGHSVGTGKVEP